MSNSDPNSTGSDFVRAQISTDIAAGRNEGRVHTRFPPEPNGYLHIGHAKSINLNFGLAEEYGGKCNLRFDDTNPEREEVEYIESIKEDIRWLGFDWEDRLFFASDYFGKLYEYAERLISQGDAYVDSLSPEEIREYRGTPTEPGKNSPYRGRTEEESLDLFRRMRRGEFADGEHVLRAKIDMSHPNITMRDPTLYRIRHFEHHRTGEEWCIYPTYDFAHGQSDAIEGITHSICTLEFENHRPLYEWLIEHLPVPSNPRQIEFARLNLTYTVMSKRKLLRLVKEEFVDGWDDPRMPTISGLRRRGYTPEAIRDFCSRIGVSKSNSTVDLALLEFSLREHLNVRAQRRMVVLDPIKVVLTNYPEEKREQFESENNPERPEDGTRLVPFGRELFVERSDFMEDPPRKWFRLAPGKEVRLKHAYFITCEEVIKDEQGDVVELRCSYDPDSRGGQSPDGRKVKGTLHWVAAADALNVEVRLYETLFDVEDPDAVPEGGDFTDNLNSESLTILSNAKAEPSLADAKPGEAYQFLRKAYFTVDGKHTKGERLVFNRSVTLKDSWARVLRNKRENE